MAVREEIYRGSGEVGRSTPQPMADADTFGAAIGRGVSQLTGALHKAKVQDLQREFQSDYSAALVGLADLTKQADVARNTAREEASLDAAGHAERVTGDLKGLSENYLGTIANPRIRERLTPQVDSLIGRIHGDEDGWQRGRRAGAIGQNAADAANGFSSQLQNNPDPAVLETSLEAGEAFIASTAGDNPALADKVRRYWNDTVATGFARGLIEANPAGAAEVLQSGALDRYFADPDTKATLLNQAQTGVRMADADLRRKQAQAEAELREQVNIFKQGLTAGNEPDDKEFDALLGQAKTLGLDAVVTDLSLAKNDLHIKRETRNWTPGEWNGAIAELKAKGDKRTPEEDIRLTAFERLRPGAISTFNSNPQEAAAAAGMPAPQVDVWGEPSRQEVDGLRAWAKSYRQTAGLSYTPFLNTDQIKAARERVQSGAVGALAVASKLSATFGVADAAEIARQIGPDNRDLQLMVGLHPSIAARYERGIDALKRNSKLFGADADDAAKVQEVFAEYASAIPQEMRTPIFEAAKMVAAGTADWTGAAELSGDDLERMFRASLQRAAGQLGRGDGSGTGGFGKWNDRFVWLPRDMAGGDFARRVSRADRAKWIKAAGGEPYYQGPNGKQQPVPEDWYARFKAAPLLTVRPGVYRPLGRDGGILRHKDGRPWEFDVRRLP